MSEIVNLNIEKARLEPDTVFASPLDIEAETGLTRGQKIAALKRWEQTLQDRLRATGEGMAPPEGQTALEAATIQKISKALTFLERPDDVSAPDTSTSPGKPGTRSTVLRR
jgi:hypothetical protein